MRNLFSLAIVVLLLAVGCSKEQGADPVAEVPDTVALGDWGIDLTAQDQSVKPGDDFNRYANGHWIDTFELPADLSRYVSFTKLSLEAEEDIRTIVEELAADDPAQGSLEQKVGDFYGSWMDTDRLNELGAAPLKPYLDGIAGIDSEEGLMHAFASVHATAPFGIGIIPDPADTTRYVAFVGQAGLGMPNRDYYIKDDERFVEYRGEYVNYTTKVLEFAGIEDAATKATEILELETSLAEVHWPPEESRDIQKIYNPMSPDQVQELAPEVDWKLVFNELGLGEIDTFVVAQTTAIQASAKIMAETPLDRWKDYLAFHFIRSNATNLSEDFDTAHYEFYSKTLRGTEEQRERWKRGVQQIDNNLGEAVGQIYVDRHFPAGNKAKMEALVANLTAALEERLHANEWMDDETREQALAKLATFEARIGYTEKWTDFTDLEISEGALLDNSMATTEFQWKQQVDRLAGPVDRQLWPYPPQTINASYNPLLNQITFPAGILQPPFFDPLADPAVNYGGIGAVIGHEIGHGFDDQGRRFDEQGRIRDWWTETADQRFSERAKRLGEQYDGYSPIEGLNVKGELTMGENIGDLGGLQMAYAAYHRYLDEHHGGEAEVIDGLTGDQRFFLAWAQVWQAVSREDELRRRLVTDPHSPAEYRINGVVRNMDAWYEAFGVGEEDALYLPPDDRVRIW